MSRQKLDPKHVRLYHFHASPFVRFIMRCDDGIWWLVVKGILQIIKFPTALWVWLFPTYLGGREPLRRLHSFVVGRTGCGKSVLLYHLIRRYLARDRKPSVVVFDPHGDLAAQVARDKALSQSERLVLVDFRGLSNRHIHFNPFDLPNPTEENLNRAQLQFSGAVERIVGETFTPRQRTLIRSCLAVMLHKPGTTLADLIRIMQDGQNADLLRYGREELPNEVDRMFFTGSFHDPLYRTTKLALVARLTDILRDPVVRRFTSHPSSFDLGHCLDRGKVIVVRFDPNTQGRDTIRTLGQLMTAAILSHVLGRPVKKRHPIHMFLDECQYFISPTIAEILGETRKFGLFLTLATQRCDALDPDLLSAVIANVGNFWVGGARSVTADSICRETGLDPQTVRKLPNLKFIHAAVNRPPKMHRLAYLGFRYAVGRSKWHARLKQQIIKYYRKLPTKVAPTKPGEGSQAQIWNPDFL